MKINIETIPHSEQRYETPGDWWLDEEGVLQVRVSKLDHSMYEGMIALHEIVEVLTQSLTEGRLNPTQHLVEETDRFDKFYEEARKPDDLSSEPGYSPACPVYNGHMVASAVEHIVAMLLGIDYNMYADEVERLLKE